VVNYTIPDFTLISPTGETISFSAVQKPLVIVFWASWCLASQQELLALKELQKEFPSLKFLGILQNDRLENAENFLIKNKINLPTYPDKDGKASYIFGVDSIPQFYIIDEKERVRLHYRGIGFSRTEEVGKILRKLTRGRHAF